MSVVYYLLIKMLIIGEVTDKFVRIGILTTGESKSYMFDLRNGKKKTLESSGYGLSTVDVALRDLISNNNTYFIKSKGQTVGQFTYPPKTITSICCQENISNTKESIAGEVQSNLTLHLGDSIYADYIFVDYLSGKISEIDFRKQLYSMYSSNFSQLSHVLCNSSNIFIPDDHEATNNFTDYNWTPLGKQAINICKQVCEEIYLGLRLTNQTSFTYYREYQGYTLVLVPRVWVDDTTHTRILRPQQVIPESSLQDSLPTIVGTGIPLLNFNSWDTQDPTQQVLKEWYTYLCSRPSIVLCGDLHVAYRARVTRVIDHKQFTIMCMGPISGTNQFPRVNSFNVPSGYILEEGLYDDESVSSASVDVPTFLSGKVYQSTSVQLKYNPFYQTFPYLVLYYFRYYGVMLFKSPVMFYRTLFLN